MVKGTPSIKDTVESLRVPHTEIDVIVVNGRSVGFNYLIKGGEKIKVYDDCRRGQGTGFRVQKLRPKFPGRPCFLADVHLGKLARHLRLLGFDTLYRQDFQDSEIIDRIKKEKRIVLTRDIGLLKNKAIRFGYFVRTVEPTAQIKEIMRRYDLLKKVRPFTLCLECNGPIRRVAKRKIVDRLPPATKQFYADFYQCRNCNKVYWKGSHHRKLTAIINRACR